MPQKLVLNSKFIFDGSDAAVADDGDDGNKGNGNLLIRLLQTKVDLH